MPPLISERRPLPHAGTVRWTAFAAGFGPALNAMANQYSMPDVIQPMRDKSWARAVGNVAFTFCTVVYVALGLMGSLAFDNVNRLISINWTTYTGIQAKLSLLCHSQL